MDAARYQVADRSSPLDIEVGDLGSESSGRALRVFRPRGKRGRVSDTTVGLSTGLLCPRRHQQKQNAGFGLAVYAVGGCEHDTMLPNPLPQRPVCASAHSSQLPYEPHSWTTDMRTRKSPPRQRACGSASASAPFIVLPISNTRRVSAKAALRFAPTLFVF